MIIVRDSQVERIQGMLETLTNIDNTGATVGAAAHRFRITEPLPVMLETFDLTPPNRGVFAACGVPHVQPGQAPQPHKVAAAQHMAAVNAEGALSRASTFHRTSQGRPQHRPERRCLLELTQLHRLLH